MNELLRFLFQGKLDDRPFHYRRMKVLRDTGEIQNVEKKPPENPNEDHKFNLVKFLSRALAGLLFICVIGIFALLFTDRQVPDVLYLTVSGIVGYFGGAISAYLGIQKSAGR